MGKANSFERGFERADSLLTLQLLSPFNFSCSLFCLFVLLLFLFPVSVAAVQARDVVKAAQEKLDRVQKKLTDVNKWLQADYGPDLSFASFVGQCYSYTQNQYVYEMCPYDSAKQKEGASATSLGQWDGVKLRQEGDDSVPTFSFTNGQHCWQGPARSLTVVLRCGVENVVRSVEEPSRCVYEMVFSTPAACDMERARRLQKELEDQMSEAAAEE